MTPPSHWLEELEMLAWRFSYLGFGPDLASMSAIELTGLYSYLSRLAAVAR